MQGGLKHWTRILLASAALAVGAGQVSAETLVQAMVSAYSGNPTLQAERARQRGTDEQVPQALSGWRPTVNTEGRIANVWSDSSDGPATENDPKSVAIGLSQPIFRGFKTINGTKAAEANVEAGKQSLLAIEQDILFQAIQAYMNVIRDRQIVGLRQQNVGVLQKQLTAADERFKVGEITRTDVAQSKARVSGAQSSVASANATLAASVANYINIVGHKPGSLKYPRLAKLPKNLEAAQAAAMEINPNILAAAYVEEASNYNIEVVKGDLLPGASLDASAQFNDNPQDGTSRSETARIEGVLTIPLYEAGRVYSSVREAKHVASQRRLEVIQAGRSVRESVSISWNNLVAAREIIRSAKEQVSAAQLALDGVRQEYFVGSRTTLDVLDAETEVVNARISLVSAERDQIV
ncbi:MAG: TolC family outer membrane protein, partial [Aestuariivirga sp.]|nr:TolC family outer membrane protein [Aestuariivirga sp.]